MLRSFVAVIILQLFNVQGQAATISAFSPAGGYSPTEVAISGSGFTDAENVFFREIGGGYLRPATFTVESDQLIHAIAPSLGNTLQQLLVVGASGAAITLSQGVPTCAAVCDFGGNGSITAIAESGGTVIQGGGGSYFVFVKSGGAVLPGGGGSNTYFVEAGGLVDLGGGGGSQTVFFEPGATILQEFDCCNLLWPVPDVSYTLFPALYNPAFAPIPIPPAAILFGSALGVISVMRRRAVA